MSELMSELEKKTKAELVMTCESLCLERDAYRREKDSLRREVELLQKQASLLLTKQLGMAEALKTLCNVVMLK